MKKAKDILIIGFALFAMFLGAGNIIFPPTLGALSGDQWLITLLGFALTGIGLPLMGITTAAKAGDSILDFSKHLGKVHAHILSFLIVIIIGPLFAIPRTASVTYELAIAPSYPQANIYVVTAIYFIITIFFALDANQVINRIGSYLTPVLILTLIFIIGVGMIRPLGPTVSTGEELAFLKGFEEGYQTMDALASIIFSSIIMRSVQNLGYHELKDQTKLTAIAGIIAGIGLAIVYGGLIYLGATSSGGDIHNLSRVELLTKIIKNLLGPWGNAMIGTAVGLACLTTAVGLTSTVAMHFSAYTHRISYKSLVIIICLLSAFIANYGVTTIIDLATPILAIIYPITIVLVILWVFDEFIPYKSTYKGACLGAIIISIAQAIFHAEDTINNLLAELNLQPIFSYFTPEKVDFNTPLKILNSLPLSRQGFAWIFPSFILGFIFYIWEAKKKYNSI